MNLTRELTEILKKKGAALAGAGDMSGIPDCGYPSGVAVAVPLPKHVIRDLQSAPTKEYYDLYYELNAKLNEIVLAGEAFLKEKGFQALAQTTDRGQVNGENRSKLPHKTVATRAGLGWIGKNCLLVTPGFGSAVRISSLLTDAPLEYGTPVLKSRCGGCSRCVKECPAQALQGTLWEAGMERERIVDVKKCYKKQVEIMTKATGIETDLCGKCFAMCVYTERYLRSA